MYRKKLSVFGSVGIAVLAASMPSIGSAQTATPEAQVTKNVENMNSFGALMSKRMASPDQNLLISPASLYLAFGSLYAGSRDETRTVLEKSFGMSDSLESNLQSFQDLNQKLQHPEVVTVANSLWTAPRFTPSPEYVDLIKSRFQATADRLDDLGPNGVNQINSWVDRNTDHMIPALVRSLDPLTVLVLLNAIAFEGKWVHPFTARATSDQPFYEGSKNYPVASMKQTQTFPYRQDSNCAVAKLPYQSGLSMVIVLPNPNVNPLSCLNSLNRSDGFKSERLNVQLPKVKFANSHSLVKPLSSMGLAEIFHHVDLTGISPMLTPKQAWVSDVLQKTVVSIDEEGTRAAAVTGVFVSARAIHINPQPPIDFKVDHPFAFAIRDDATGADLFLGIVRHAH